MPTLADSMFILADDLSGAADCAIAAARAGLKSVVLFEPDIHVQAEVVAVDADTRQRPAQEAAATNRALWKAQSAPKRLFYKKIDSTLRGNFAAEMAALTEAGVAIVAPAYPATGRITRNGKVWVKGVPLEQTEVWANERMTGEADIVQILCGQGVPAVNVPLAGVRGDLRAELTRLVSDLQIKAIVCDAEEDSDLARIAVASMGLPVYWVGSAGLAAHLPGAAKLEGHTAMPRLAVTGAIVTVVGSLSAVSRQQAEILEAGATLEVFVPSPEVLRAGEADSRWQALRAGVGQALHEGRDVLIRTGLEEINDLRQGHVLCDSLRRLLTPFASEIGALIATGGETARALLPAFGASALQLVREIEPGVPLSVAIGPRSIAVVTKAGAFGSANALLACYAALSAARAEAQTGSI
ncbi:MAG: four-carbon acid sugar kinase family protein [Betaproteobacteria bacterium]